MTSRLIYTYAIGLLALFLLFFLAVPYYSTQIPKALEESAKKQLDTINANWAEVKSTNRDLTLTGKAPTPEQHQAAMSALSHVRFVRNIHDQTTQNIISPYAMNLEWENGKLMINGFVPNAESQQKVLTLLRAKYEGKDISQQIRVAQGEPEKWTELVSVILNNMLPLERAEVDLIDQNLGLSARAGRTSDKDKLLEQLAYFKQYGYTLNAHVIANDAIKLRCQRQFDELLSSKQILFASGNAKIKASSYTLLNQLAQMADICSDTVLEIVGHTDNRGQAKKNMTLSHERARSVAQWLIKSGIDEQRIKTVGYGSERPVADNSTEAGRAKNRRIEFIVRSH